MRLDVLGSSPAWPNPDGAHSGYLVEGAGGRLLLDCGPGVLARLRAREGWPLVDAIAITHFHLDHWGDLVPWVWGSLYQKGVHGRPALWIYEGGHAKLEALGERLGFRDMFDRVFDVHEYRDGVPFTTAGFGIEARRLPHYTVETYGFRVVENGVCLAYSGDSGPAEALVELARDADLFLCEATLADGLGDGAPRGHLSADEALAAATASRCRRLLLTHRPAELGVPAGLELAHDGMTVELFPRTNAAGDRDTDHQGE